MCTYIYIYNTYLPYKYHLDFKPKFWIDCTRVRSYRVGKTTKPAVTESSQNFERLGQV